jgi:hypothetical protein
VAAADQNLREHELGEAGIVELLSSLIVANNHGRQVLSALMRVYHLHVPVPNHTSESHLSFEQLLCVVCMQS